MNTPAHLLIGAAAFGKPDNNRITAAAMLGALAPDVSLYLMVAVSIWVMGISAQVVFDQLYYSDLWQSIFALDNSFILWGVALGFAIWRQSTVGIAFTAAALLHLALDFPLHTHDARQHFWPLTDWVFESPVSYWDSAAYAGLVSPVSLMLSFGCATLIVTKFQSFAVRVIAVLLAIVELLSSGFWRLFF